MTLPAEKLDRRMTLDEYLAFEETSEVKHEFHDGEILAMSGGTVRHGRIAENLKAMLYNRLRGSGCEHYGSDTKVATSASRRFVYPDATIVCGGVRYHPEDARRSTIINARVIFEVLSDSTEHYDRTEKFDHYRLIETLEEYVLLAQETPRVEGYLRQADGTWAMAVWQGMEAVAEVRCLGLKLPLAELYENALTP